MIASTESFQQGSWYLTRTLVEHIHAVSLLFLFLFMETVPCTAMYSESGACNNGGGYLLHIGGD